MLIGCLILFLAGSRFHAEDNKIICSEGKCEKPHEHGELNYHERFHVEAGDNFAVATIKSCANFWEANATGMTFAIIIGGAALSLLLSRKKFEKVLSFKGIKGAALGSIFGMPLNMCANCSAVTSVSMTSQNGSPEAALGIILGGALLNFIGIVTMCGLFSPAVVISRIVFSYKPAYPQKITQVSLFSCQTAAQATEAGSFNTKITCYILYRNPLQWSRKCVFKSKVSFFHTLNFAVLFIQQNKS